MSQNEIIVIIAALAAIVWINWHFFFAGRRASAALPAAADGLPQDITIAVRGGYEPATIRVRRGVPVRLTFDRQESSGCSEEVVFPDLGVKRFLPAFARTTIELLPQQVGTFAFTCGMGMLKGRLVVVEQEG